MTQTKFATMLAVVVVAMTVRYAFAVAPCLLRPVQWETAAGLLRLLRHSVPLG